jgi:hypothetical protein
LLLVKSLQDLLLLGGRKYTVLVKMRVVVLAYNVHVTLEFIAEGAFWEGII